MVCNFDATTVLDNGSQIAVAKRGNMRQSITMINSVQLAKSFGTLTEYVIQYRRMSGETTTIAREVYHRGMSAAVLIYNRVADTVILVRQFRPPAMLIGDPSFLLEVCGGLLDGDQPEVCAIREAEEETGVKISNLRQVARAYSNPAATTDVVTLFIADFASGAIKLTGGVASEGEETEVVELPFLEAYSKIGTGEIVDMKTIILLQHLLIDRSA